MLKFRVVSFKRKLNTLRNFSYGQNRSFFNLNNRINKITHDKTASHTSVTALMHAFRIGEIIGCSNFRLLYNLE